MNLVNCYRLLGLTEQAGLQEIKSSYRRLVRQYHPDANPGNTEAQAQFIRVTEAYKFLIGVVQKSQEKKKKQQFPCSAATAKITKVTTEQPGIESIAKLSKYDRTLKWNSYETLQQLLKERRLVRAIALVEGLAQRLPQDGEVLQWQGIIYQQRGKQLIKEGNFDKGKIYLKKAVQTDPHNHSLLTEVERELQQIDRELF